jgi:pimeloyl-ACP methyl ester carboxylesterase
MLLSATLTYPLPKSGGSGRVLVYGDPNLYKTASSSSVLSSPPTGTTTTTTTTLILFCAGFPDDIRAFQPLAMRLASSSSHIVCGVTCPPGYDSSSICVEQQQSCDYDLVDMAKCIGLATQALKTHVLVAANNNGTTTKTVGVFHDWGCIAGNICANDYYDFDGIVYVDVLPSPPNVTVWTRGFTIHQTIVWTLYTSLYAVMHAVQRHIPWPYLAALPLTVCGVCDQALRVLGLVPLKNIDYTTIADTYQKDRLSSRQLINMMYPYYQLYKNLLRGRPVIPTASCLSAQTPTLFLYGVDKTLQFHTKKDLVWMGQYSHLMKSVAVDGAGHWLYVQKPDVTFDEIDAFLRRI